MSRSPSPGNDFSTASQPVSVDVPIPAGALDPLATELGFFAFASAKGIHQPVPASFNNNAFFVTQQGVQGQDKVPGGTLRRTSSLWGRGAPVVDAVPLKDEDNDNPQPEWDRMFQETYNMPTTDVALEQELRHTSKANDEYAGKAKLVAEARVKFTKLRDEALTSLVDEFEKAAVEIVEIVIRERGRDRRHQSVRPLSQKELPQMFIHRNVFYHSFNEDSYREFYGGMQAAHKVLNAEIRTLRMLYQEKIPDLHIPLCTVVTFCGFKVFASAVVQGLHESQRVYGPRGDKENFAQLTTNTSARMPVPGIPAPEEHAPILKGIASALKLTEFELTDLVQIQQVGGGSGQLPSSSVPPFLQDEYVRGREQARKNWEGVPLVGPPDLSLFGVQEATDATNISQSRPTVKVYCFNVAGCMPYMDMTFVAPLHSLLATKVKGPPTPIPTGGAKVKSSALVTKPENNAAKLLSVLAAGSDRIKKLYHRPSVRFLHSALSLYKGEISTASFTPWATSKENTEATKASEWIAVDQVQATSELLRCWPDGSSVTSPALPMNGPVLKEVLHQYGVNLCFMGAVYRCLMEEPRSTVLQRVDAETVEAFHPKLISEEEMVRLSHSKGKQGGKKTEGSNKTATVDHTYVHVPPIVGLGAHGMGGGPLIPKPPSQFDEQPGPTAPKLPKENSQTVDLLVPNGTTVVDVGVGAGTGQTDQSASQPRPLVSSGGIKRRTVDVAVGPSFVMSPRVPQLEPTAQVLGPASVMAPPSGTASTARSARTTHTRQQGPQGASTARGHHTSPMKSPKAESKEAAPQTPQLQIAKITLQNEGIVLQTLRVEMLARSFRAILNEHLRGIFVPKPNPPPPAQPQGRRSTKQGKQEIRRASMSDFFDSPSASGKMVVKSEEKNTQTKAVRLLAQINALEVLSLSERSPLAQAVIGGGLQSVPVDALNPNQHQHRSQPGVQEAPLSTGTCVVSKAIARANVLAADPVYCDDEETRFEGTREKSLGDRCRDRTVLLLNRLLCTGRGTKYFWESVLMPEMWSRYQDLGRAEHFHQVPQTALRARVCELCGIELVHESMLPPPVMVEGNPEPAALRPEHIVGIHPVAKSINAPLGSAGPGVAPTPVGNATPPDNAHRASFVQSPGCVASVEGAATIPGVSVVKSTTQLQHLLESTPAASTHALVENPMSFSANHQHGALIAHLDTASRPAKKDLMSKDEKPTRSMSGSYNYSVQEAERVLLEKLNTLETQRCHTPASTSSTLRGADQTPYVTNQRLKEMPLADISRALQDLISIYTFGGTEYCTDLALAVKKLAAVELDMTLLELQSFWEARGLDGPVYTRCKGCGLFINPSQASEHSCTSNGTVTRVIDKDPVIKGKGTGNVSAASPDRKVMDYTYLQRKNYDPYSVCTQCTKCGQLLKAYDIPSHECETVTTKVHIDRGIHPVGMGNGTLPDHNISASSCAPGSKPSFARLGLQGAKGWQPETSIVEQEWIQIKLPAKKLVHALAVAGDRSGHYARYYIVEYSLDGHTWNRYKGTYKHRENILPQEDTLAKSGFASMNLAVNNQAALLGLVKKGKEGSEPKKQQSLSNVEKEKMLGRYYQENDKTQRTMGQAPSWQRSRHTEELHVGQLLVLGKVNPGEKDGHTSTLLGRKPALEEREFRVPCALAGSTGPGSVSFNEFTRPFEARLVRLVVGSDGDLHQEEDGPKPASHSAPSGNKGRVGLVMEIFCADLHSSKDSANTRWSECIPLRCIDWFRPMGEGNAYSTRLAMAKAELNLLKNISTLEKRVELTQGSKPKLVADLQDAKAQWYALMASWGPEREGDMADALKKEKAKTGASPNKLRMRTGSTDFAVASK